MIYKKPQIIAQTVAKKSYVAGCPTMTAIYADTCEKSGATSSCEINRSR